MHRAAAFEARLKRNPKSTSSQMYLVAAYSMAGQPAQAQRVADGLL
jgi:hypothetical protein